MNTRDFPTRLQQAWHSSLLCLGLDPEPGAFPLALRAAATSHDRREVNRAFTEFCIAIVDKVAPFICAVKPQVAFFSAHGAEAALEAVCRHIKERFPHLVLILDAKRGDIGNTARQYAQEAFVRYQADAVTLSPYLGLDSITPFLDYADKGVFLLCRTSNPGGADLQELRLADNRTVYEHVALLVAQWDGGRGQCGLVVGAPFPAALQRVRELAPHLVILAPGIGAQQGDLAATVKAGLRKDGRGLVINASRAILYASAGTDFAEAAAATACDLQQAIAALC